MHCTYSQAFFKACVPERDSGSICYAICLSKAWNNETTSPHPQGIQQQYIIKSIPTLSQLYIVKSAAKVDNIYSGKKTPSSPEVPAHDVYMG